jgi:hypothetical protein
MAAALYIFLLMWTGVANGGALFARGLFYLVIVFTRRFLRTVAKWHNRTFRKSYPAKNVWCGSCSNLRGLCHNCTARIFRQSLCPLYDPNDRTLQSSRYLVSRYLDKGFRRTSFPRNILRPPVSTKEVMRELFPARKRFESRRAAV